MEVAAEQPYTAPAPAPAPADDEVTRLRARIVEIEARPGTPAEWSLLMEAACGERDQLRRRLEQELAKTTHLEAALRRIAAADGDHGAVRSIAAEALGREVT